jgi:hypothetical protein
MKTGGESVCRVAEQTTGRIGMMPDGPDLLLAICIESDESESLIHA